MEAIKLNKKLAIKNLPKEARPRERLVQFGAAKLATYELLAILLRTGNRELGPIELAALLLERYPDLYELKHITFEELTSIPGIGPAKAVELLAAIELGARMTSSKRELLGYIRSSEDAAQHFLQEMSELEQEHVMAIFLTTKNEIIRKTMVFKGDLNTSLANPREIYREALRCSAARLIIGHNHPSGNPEPSQADIKLTKRMIEAGKFLGIDCLDHIIVGHHKYVTLHDYGVFS